MNGHVQKRFLRDQSGVVAMVVALGTVGLKTLQAARVDPVKALRDE